MQSELARAKQFIQAEAALRPGLIQALDSFEGVTLSSRAERAKKILAENVRVLYGIFGIISSTDFFPPMNFLNEFYMLGNDPCDQDERMSRWLPFSLSPEEYASVRDWWVNQYPAAKEDALGVESWADWMQEILKRL